jgi:hypothetical protein
MALKRMACLSFATFATLIFASAMPLDAQTPGSSPGTSSPPATAASPSGSISFQHLAETKILAPNRMAFVNGVYLSFYCIIASGNGAEDATTILTDIGLVAGSVPFYSLVETFVSGAIQVVSLKKGTSYCLVTRWSAANLGRLLSGRTYPLTLYQRSYANGRAATTATTIDSKEKTANGFMHACKDLACIKPVVMGGTSADGMTTCVEMAGSSVVVGVGNVTNLIDADQKVMPGACSARRF